MPSFGGRSPANQIGKIVIALREGSVGILPASHAARTHQNGRRYKERRSSCTARRTGKNNLAWPVFARSQAI